MKVAALVLAAGRGERLGHEVPKAFVRLLGRSLVERSLRALAESGAVDRVQPVVSRQDLERFATLELEAFPGVAPPVAGGAERQDSVAAGLEAIGDDFDLVVVHDAARCLVSRDEIHRVIEVAGRMGAAILAIPARDTIKRVRDGVVVETPDRRECWAAQTPQVFRVSLLREALQAAREAGVLGTDDAQLVERLGVEVAIVEGSPDNMKITVPTDLAAAESLLRAQEASKRAPTRAAVGGEG